MFQKNQSYSLGDTKLTHFIKIKHDNFQDVAHIFA